MKAARVSSRLRDLVRAELDRADVSQTQVAEQLGLSQKHVSQVLVGRCGIAVDLAADMLKVAGRDLVLTTVPLPTEDAS